MRDNPIIAVIVGLLILIMGISAFLVVGRTKPTEGELADPVPTVVNSKQLPQKNTEAVVLTGEEVTQEPTEAVLGAELVVPTVRTGLESSNPGAANLASGGLQLIEFFAFW